MIKKEKFFSYLLEGKILEWTLLFSLGCISFWNSSRKIGAIILGFLNIVAGTVRIIIVGCVLIFIRCIYRSIILPCLQGDCRFHPTCSEYCIQAFQQHAVLRAIILVIWRLARCHPWGQCGNDPVPPSLFPSS